METGPSRKSSAPYGQACTNCVRAKCRCVRDGSTCEKCLRLKEKCIPSASVRKRGARTSTGLKKSRLEDKLDDLVSLLRHQTSIPSATLPTNPALLTPHSDHSLPETSVTFPAEILTDQDVLHFHDHHLCHFPFMLLPRTTTAEQLQLEKPILSLTIHAICTKAISRQRLLSKQVRETLASQIMVEGERSLDLLLSLIVFIIWSTYMTQGRPFLTMMMGLARSLTSYLKIDKPHNPSACPSIEPWVENKEIRTSEGSRALLAVFALSAIISSVFKVDFMPWSSQIDEACDKLLKDQEAEWDWVLVTTARIARIIVNAAEIFRRASDEAAFAKHVVLNIGPLDMALEHLKNTLTVEQRRHNAIVTFFYGAEIAIHELALLQPLPPASTYPHPLDCKRIASLSSCLQTSKACMDHFLATEVTKLIGPSMLIFAYCLKTTYKLSVLQDPAWDTALVKATIDLVHCIQLCAEAAERGNAKLKEQTGEDSVLAPAAETMRSTASHWRVPEPNVPTAGSTMTSNWGAVEAADMLLMDLSDEFWLQGALDF